MLTGHLTATDIVTEFVARAVESAKSITIAISSDRFAFYDQSRNDGCRESYTQEAQRRMNCTTHCIMCGRPIHEAMVLRRSVGIENLPAAVDGCTAAAQWIHHHDIFGRDVLTVFIRDGLEIARQQRNLTGWPISAKSSKRINAIPT